MSIPEWWDAPIGLPRIEGPCGLVAAWQVLRHFQRRATVRRIALECGHTVKHGVFTVGLAAGLQSLGLDVEFFSDPDLEIGFTERRCYSRALRAGVCFSGPPDLTALLRASRGGAVLVVFFDTPSGKGTFSPVTGLRKGRLLLPLADEGDLPLSVFKRRWAAPRVLRQAVLVRPRRRQVPARPPNNP
jgi:hypothetical protein